MKANTEALAPLWNLALLLEHSGQLEEAERHYRQVLDRAPKEEEARFRMGYLRLQREDYRGAAEAFEGCLKYRPAWPEAHANLALAYAGLGERDHAERLYEKMLDGDPKSMDALRGLAALSIQANDFDTALEFHVRLIDLGERSPAVLYNAGLMYEKAGQLEKAVRFYRDALAQQADMPEALLNLVVFWNRTARATRRGIAGIRRWKPSRPWHKGILVPRSTSTVTQASWPAPA